MTWKAMAWLLAAALAFAPAVEAADAPGTPADEVIHYRWKMLGVAGLVARLIFPARGQGALSTNHESASRLASELRITSQGADSNEFWAYGSTIDPGVPRVIEAWNAYSFRGRNKRKDAELGDAQVIDIAAGIYLLRTSPPSAPRRMRIWSDGKVYPVAVVPGGRVGRRIDGVERQLAHYWIEGRDEPGERRWKGRLEVWLTPDEAAIPVEILFQSNRGRVRLRQQQTPLD